MATPGTRNMLGAAGSGSTGAAEDHAVQVEVLRRRVEAMGEGLRRLRCGARLDIAYSATVAQIAHARAVNEIDPPAPTGIRSRMLSRSRARAVSSSDMA